MREPGFYWLIYFEDCRLNEELFTDESVARARLADLRQAWNCHLFQHIDGPRIPDAEQLEKLCAVAHAAREYIEAAPRPESAGYYLALDEELAALGPLPEEKKA